MIGLGLGLGLSAPGVVASGPTLGPELLTNGDMSSATGWTLNDGFGLGVASIGGGVLTLEDPEGTSPNAQQLQNAVSQGATYRVVYTVVAVAGEVYAKVGNSAGTFRTTPGTYQEDIVCGATTALGFQLQLDNGTATIDDASVKLLS
jgi:hypothetical protein